MSEDLEQYAKLESQKERYSFGDQGGGKYMPIGSDFMAGYAMGCMMAGYMMGQGMFSDMQGSDRYMSLDQADNLMDKYMPGKKDILADKVLGLNLSKKYFEG